MPAVRDDVRSYRTVEPRAMNPVDRAIPPCDIRVDKDGIWYYRGAEIIHREIVELFYRHLERDDLGRYVIHWRGERCHLEVEDTPFVVWKIAVVADREDPVGLSLHLSDGTEEMLDPASLFVGPQNVPYCGIRGGEFLARFSRKAYYQLARYVNEGPEEGDFYLCVGGRRYLLPIKKEKTCRTSCA